MRLADVVVPDTTSAALALEVVTTYSVPALVNHCQRSYRLAASLAVIEGFAVDHEVLWVAGMVHDLGPRRARGGQWRGGSRSPTRSSTT